MENHVHLLVRTRLVTLSRALGRLLTGYALRFNRRHGRVGHLFQNRFKSILCEDEGYFLELVRYIHLNPLRAGLVEDLERLERYPHTGHSSVLGHCARPWHDAGAVLGRFGLDLPAARLSYRVFVAAGVPLGRRPELTRGSLLLGPGGRRVLPRSMPGREAWSSDERVLGSAELTGAIRGEPEREETPRPGAVPRTSLDELIDRVCAEAGVERSQLGCGISRSYSKARDGLAFLWVAVLGRRGGELAAVLGVRRASVYRSAGRGAVAAERWRRLLVEPPRPGGGPAV
jgi:hypothetical protein